jgi:peptide/nickel transport system substrate-binding protein
LHRAIVVAGGLVALIGAARCSNRSGPVPSQTAPTLRVGIGGIPQLSPQAGLRQIVSNLSLEGLVNLSGDGRPRPILAENWTTAPDGLSLTLQLRPAAKFQDGTPVTAPSVLPSLRAALPRWLGPAFEDIDEILAVDDAHIRFVLRRRSPLLIEALETAIQKPGKDGVGTGQYVAETLASPMRLNANQSYYLGPPAIDHIVVTAYPNVRAAWAELLRGGLDMLFEVNMDALDSLQSSSNVAVFSFVRHYQYLVMFGSRAPMFKSAEIRRELNAAIDRSVLVRDGLNGHGVVSSGPVSPEHWAFGGDVPKLAFNAALAARLAGRHLRFTCLVPADSVYERVALTVKRQLAAASVDMQVVEATQEQLVLAATRNDYDAMLVDAISGPSMFRSYRSWHSGGSSTIKPIESPLIDAALDRVRHAASDDEYRAGVTAFQQAIVDDPPAIFLAWGERARAVSRRFDVPVPEDGRDVLSTLRMWRPTPNQQTASRN